MFGLVALAGVVVNDSIVLIDFINHRVRSGMPLLIPFVRLGNYDSGLFFHERNDDRWVIPVDD